MLSCNKNKRTYNFDEVVKSAKSIKNSSKFSYQLIQARGRGARPIIYRSMSLEEFKEEREKYRIKRFRFYSINFSSL